MSLAEELHQRRPFTSVQEEALLSVFVTQDILHHNLQKMLRPYGLSLAQYNVLRILRGAGEDGLPLMAIARRMIVRYPNVTRLTDRLETNGWIHRERCTHDRRIVRGFVTVDGLELLARINGEIDHLVVHLMRGVQDERLRELIAVLEQVRLPLRSGNGDGEAPTADDSEESC
jgi:MarR family transcriptional regulator, organic hydroperoxide resistance regulator